MEAALEAALHRLTGAAPQGQRFLLAVSGGLDSVSLVHLCARLNLSFAIAHANFQLRGEESELDAAFVRNLAADRKVPFFYTSFDTKGECIARGGSVQMVARTLRYEWLQSLRTEEGYDWLLTAHHLEDSVETFFINLFRGAGLRGLAGIPEQRDRILRPLARFSRESIRAFQQEYAFPYREDSSNAKTDYLRNKIRHQVLPLLEALTPGFGTIAGKSLHALQGALVLYEEAIARYRAQAVRDESGKVGVYWLLFEQHPAAETLVFELLRPYGLNAVQCADIWSRRHTSIGSRFYSDTYVCLIDRQCFLIAERSEEEPGPEVAIAGPGAYSRNGLWLSVSREIDREKGHTGTDKVLVPVDALSFPLVWRLWRPGDRFCPSGMKGRHKKIQDFLTDLRLDRLKKQEVTVLEDATGKILWVVGYRSDERFRVRAESPAYWSLELSTKA